MTASQGMPDWQSVIRTEDFDLLGAYNDAGLRFAVPKAAHLASKADGSPDFFLEFLSDQNSQGPDECQYAMLTMGLEKSGDLATACAALKAAGSGAALLACTFTTGSYVHFELNDTHVSAPFAWQGAGRATLNARLASDAARLFYGALAHGNLTVARAAIECEVAAVLPRLDLQVRFDTEATVRALQQALDGNGTGISFAALSAYLSTPSSGLFSVTGSVGGAATQLGLVLAARLRLAFGRYTACRRIDDGPYIRLDLPAAGAAACTHWDLRTPCLGAVPVLLRYDPFSVLASRVARDELTKFTRIARLPDQLLTRRVTIASAIPEQLRNCEQITVNLEVAAADAASGTSSAYSLDLYPPQRQSAQVDLRYALVHSKQPYRVSVTVVQYDDVIDGPWRDGGGDYLFIDAGWLPSPTAIVTVSAAAALLEQAVLTIGLTGAAADPERLGATLERDCPSASFLVAATDTARLCIVAHNSTDPAHTITLDLPCHSVTLEQTAFSQYGAQAVPVEVRFHADSSCVQLEFLPESADANAVLLEFSAATPASQLNYFASSMFNNRYRFRVYSDREDESAPWSAFLPPDRALVIGMYADGARAEAMPSPPGVPTP
ncbi:hypothetical protein F2P45_29705 [Massilia sp. CCM 8733]|uniref:Uncharacterized protein n=1 Tax=Massilia mucilaginosa TaxID=2609282 RepID=A0ABX0P2S9_9BURK|nr:hypothetical protein [Massilia mucilaginosa]NHZ93155.1 hypothetical protein [Massilia mucilaginosa]